MGRDVSYFLSLLQLWHRCCLHLLFWILSKLEKCTYLRSLFVFRFWSRHDKTVPFSLVFVHIHRDGIHMYIYRSLYFLWNFQLCSGVYIHTHVLKYIFMRVLLARCYDTSVFQYYVDAFCECANNWLALKTPFFPNSSMCTYVSVQAYRFTSFC